MDVDGLGLEWDKISVVRDRVRAHRRIHVFPSTQKWCEPNRANGTMNAMVLLPCLQRLRTTASWKLPYLEPLQNEISILHQKNGIPLEEKIIYTSAVEVKKLLGFVKRRVQRKEVTKACLFKKSYRTCCKSLELGNKMAGQ